MVTIVVVVVVVKDSVLWILGWINGCRVTCVRGTGSHATADGAAISCHCSLSAGRVSCIRFLWRMRTSVLRMFLTCLVLSVASSCLRRDASAIRWLAILSSLITSCVYCVTITIVVVVVVVAVVVNTTWSRGRSCCTCFRTRQSCNNRCHSKMVKW